MKTKITLLLVILLLLLAACGKKGPVRPIDTTVANNTQIETGTESQRCSE